MPTSDQGIDTPSGALGSLEDILSRSAAPWNAGDLRGFLACYNYTPDTGSLRLEDRAALDASTRSRSELIRSSEIWHTVVR
jgi:hypothetical protein